MKSLLFNEVDGGMDGGLDDGIYCIMDDFIYLMTYLIFNLISSIVAFSNCGGVSDKLNWDPGVGFKLFKS